MGYMGISLKFTQAQSTLKALPATPCFSLLRCGTLSGNLIGGIHRTHNMFCGFGKLTGRVAKLILRDLGWICIHHPPKYDILERASQAHR